MSGDGARPGDGAASPPSPNQNASRGGQKSQDGESNTVIVRAFIANVGIAIAKFVAAAMTGSSAMLTEGMHSLVDSTNQVLLWYGKRQARQPADGLHPLGYARELYFWSFIVAMLVFALGAGIALYEGVTHILRPEETTSPLIAFAVLGIAFCLEGWSWRTAWTQFDAVRHGRRIFRTIREMKDTPTLIVLLEDSAALGGLILAAAGIGLELLTGDAVWDGIASIGIGVLLAIVSITLLHESKHLLIGESADDELIDAIRSLLDDADAVVAVPEVIAIHLGPEEVVCIAMVDFENSLPTGDLERQVETMERTVAKRFDAVTRIYIRPTTG